ncbi:peptidylprolyl isomerase [Halovenus rubra]|uniref:Peptidylprolyl isomerase n=2 Tax=Halovenus rubra TaxID=869890 RepID=A0ACC7DYS6_9EURY|nr:peptidylprolyl isomerase [Halovenus rubra]
MAITDEDSVTISYTGRLDDGTVFDTSDEDLAREVGLDQENPERDFKPLEVKLGSGRIIEGLSEELIGMTVGDEKTLTIPPEKAYGEYTDERIADYDRGDFEEMIGDRELAEGFNVETEDGLPGEVKEITPDEVVVDFNHELAGETLTFEIEVLDVE